MTQVLTAGQQLPRSVRYALATVEGLMLSCPAAACETLLGWWNPTSDDSLARLAEAQELEAAEGAEGEAEGEEGYPGEEDRETGGGYGEEYQVRMSCCHGPAGLDFTFPPGGSFSVSKKRSDGGRTGVVWSCIRT